MEDFCYTVYNKNLRMRQRWTQNNLYTSMCDKYTRYARSLHKPIMDIHAIYLVIKIDVFRFIDAS